MTKKPIARIHTIRLHKVIHKMLQVDSQPDVVADAPARASAANPDPTSSRTGGRPASLGESRRKRKKINAIGNNTSPGTTKAARQPMASHRNPANSQDRTLPTV